MDKIPNGAKVYDRITVVRGYEKTTVTKEPSELMNDVSIFLLSLFVLICLIYLTFRTKRKNSESELPTVLKISNVSKPSQFYRKLKLSFENSIIAGIIAGTIATVLGVSC